MLLASCRPDQPASHAAAQQSPPTAPAATGATASAPSGTLAVADSVGHRLGILQLRPEPRAGWHPYAGQLAAQGAAFTLCFPAVEVGVEEEAELSGEPSKTLLKEASVPANLPPAPTHPNLLSILLPPNSAKPRVLVVEDEPNLRAYLRELLSPACEMLIAADGQEVLSREAPVDLIITDAMMPRLSGIELLAHLKADPARADDTHRRAALTVGVDDYLTKPFAPAERLARVRVLLARHNVRRQFAALPEEAPDELAAPAAAAAEAAGIVGAANIQLAEWQTQVAGHLTNEQFGPAELARLLGLSERTLYCRLGELAGLTLMAWLRELRLDQARQLLEAGGFGSVATGR